MLRRSVVRVLAGSFALLAGCGGDGGTGVDVADPCTGDVTVSVSAGTTPTFTWAPACLVLALLVEQEASDMWFLEATGEGIASGVRYGTVPSGASGDGPAVALVQGTTYEVILFRGTAQNATIAAIREFTP
jgi:hypothetical protein